MKQFYAVLGLFLILSTSSAFALPKAPVDDINFRPAHNKDISAVADYDFEGIVKLSNCSGSLVLLEGQSDNAKALVLTNGHCVPRTFFGGLLNPGEVVVNKTVHREMKIFKNLTTLYPITAVKIIYATMTNTDMAIYELDETYAEIYARTKVKPLTLVSKRPVVGTSIQIISGYWERGYSCGVDGFVYSLLEAGYTWFDSIRYTEGCDTIGGTSGSPIIAEGTKDVIAVNNTSNESGYECSMNNPCEVNEAGDVYIEKGLRYAQQTYNFYTCLTADFSLDLDLPHCELPQ